jgi:hypothetical protein
VDITSQRSGLDSWQVLSATFSYLASALAISGAAPDGPPSTAYSFTYTRTGGAGPFIWSITVGSLPPGVTLNTGTGQISGTPTTTGTYSWTVQVMDSFGTTVSDPDSVTIAYATLTLSGTYAAATVGAAYSSDLTIAGGNGIYSNPRATVGSVPAGLSLSIVSGKLRLSGTPTGTGGTVIFTAAIDSSDGQTATSSQSVVVSALHRYWRVYIPANQGSSTNVLIQGGASVGTGSKWNNSSGMITVSSATASSATVTPALSAWVGTNSAWQTTASMPAWNRVDFGSAKRPTSLDILSAGAGFTDRNIKNFLIQWSDDDSTWTTAVTVTAAVFTASAITSFAIP